MIVVIVVHVKLGYREGQLASNLYVCWQLDQRIRHFGSMYQKKGFIPIQTTWIYGFRAIYGQRVYEGIR